MNRLSNAVRGFTLIELMMTLAIGAILLTVAVPSFSTFIKNSRITASTNKVITAVNQARSEASKRGVRVVLCRSANVGAADPDCGGSSKDWSTGWLVFAVGTSRATPLYDPAQDDILLGQFSIDGNIYIKTNAANDKNLEFNPDGTTNESGSTARFAICDDRGYKYGKLIEVSPVGRAVSEDAGSCTPA